MRFNLRSLRGIAVFGLVVGSVLMMSGLSFATQNPPGCLGNALQVNFFRNIAGGVEPGGTISYTVQVSNPAAGQGCDVLDATVVVICPGTNGLPNAGDPALVRVLATGANFPIGASEIPIVYGPVPCPINVTAPPVASVTAAGSVGDYVNTPPSNLAFGRLLDSPTQDDPFVVQKQLTNPVVYCGDGVINRVGETCDPPGAPGGAIGNICRADCTVCGDGVLNAGEQCDDGNNVNTDGCRNTCLLPVCGDGIVDPGEFCDDGNQNDNDGCRNDCTACGDSVIQGTYGETCDPPGAPGGAIGNTCRTDCTVCGDGVLNPGEQCDDGNDVNTDGCRNSCLLPVCGDGIVDPGEYCDDGNQNNDDACRNDCTACGDSVLQPGETCDPPGSPAGASGNLCRDDCSVCGDGVVDLGEQCDDGNNIDTDSCRNDCTPPQQARACRLTGGGIVWEDTLGEWITDPTIFAEVDRATFGGQVGAPYVIAGCHDQFGCIQGEWTHMRHRRRGSFHASQYLSFICQCVDANGVPVGEPGELCNPCSGPDCHADDYPGPEPRPSPANIACFTGVGMYQPTNGRRDMQVAFRVEIEDRGEPGAGSNAGNLEDVYRIRIWVPGTCSNDPGRNCQSNANCQAGGFCRTADAMTMAEQACCSTSIDSVLGLLGTPNVADGGNLVRGNLQIHPQTGNPNNSGTCPLP